MVFIFFEVSSLAPSGQKVFLSADALGRLADFFCARRTPTVARSRAHAEAAGHAARQLDGAAGAVCVDDRLSVAGRCHCGMARVGAWVYRTTAGTGHS